MKLIPTTATTVKKIKAVAKSIRDCDGISLAAALEQAAKRAGYESWFHTQWCLKRTNSATPQDSQERAELRRHVTDDPQVYLAYLTRKAVSATVERFPGHGDCFHEVQIDGNCFRGSVASGTPSIVRYSARRRGYEQGWVQLGRALIAQSSGRLTSVAEDMAAATLPWWVCKYSGAETRINVDDLSPAGRHALAYEFGIPFHYRLTADHKIDADPDFVSFRGYEGGAFFASPAGSALQSWLAQHPRKAKTFGASSYLGDWAETAQQPSDKTRSAANGSLGGTFNVHQST